MKSTKSLALLFCVALLPACKGTASADKDVASAEGTPTPHVDDGGGEAPADGLPKAEDILEKAVEASGGRDAIAKIESFHLVGTISAPKLKLQGEVETWWKGGDFYMVQNVTGIGVNRSGKKGDKIWMQETINGLRELEGLEAEQHLWASSLMLAANWQDHFASAKTTGTRTVDGAEIIDITLTSKSGAELKLAIDATTFLVVEQSFDVVNPMGTTPVSMQSRDYREVEGIKIAYQQVTDLDLVELTQTLTKVELNAEVDEAKFDMPGGDLDVIDGKAAAPPAADDPTLSVSAPVNPKKDPPAANAPAK